ncbi:MAG: FmdB family zinc ribbon protein, partial [Streptosporangiales bacterium]
MARYEYKCRTCGDHFEVSRPMAEANASADCPCGEPHADRVFSSVAVTGRAASTPAAAPAGGGGGCCG